MLTRPETVMSDQTPRQLVSNDVGAIVSGAPGRRRVMLLYKPAWQVLHTVEDLWISSRSQAVRLVLGCVEMTSPRAGLYVATTAPALEGYGGMLKALCSGVADEDSVETLDYLGTKLSPPREWGPYAGVRRRGRAMIGGVQKAHNLEYRDMAQVVERVRRAFLARATVLGSG